jgi:hypothetical protein
MSQSEQTKGDRVKREGQGWILFSMIVLFTAGIMRIFDGIWLVHNSNTAQSLTGGILGSSLKAYGWVYIVVGALLILVAVSLMSGSELGRWVGVAAGAILAITAVWAMPYYPVWALTYIAIGVGVIYGLSVHGGHEEAELA